MISFFLDDQINQFSEHVEDSIGSLKSAEFPKCQPQKFKYPKAKFGSGLERSFNSSWYKLHPWLYYDVKTSVVLYEVCVSQGKKGNLTLSTKKEDAFISTVFRIGKKLQKNSENTNSQIAIGSPLVCQVYEKHGYNIMRET